MDDIFNASALPGGQIFRTLEPFRNQLPFARATTFTTGAEWGLRLPYLLYYACVLRPTIRRMPSTCRYLNHQSTIPCRKYKYVCLGRSCALTTFSIWHSQGIPTLPPPIYPPPGRTFPPTQAPGSTSTSTHHGNAATSPTSTYARGWPCGKPSVPSRPAVAKNTLFPVNIPPSTPCTWEPTTTGPPAQLTYLETTRSALPQRDPGIVTNITASQPWNRAVPYPVPYAWPDRQPRRLTPFSHLPSSMFSSHLSSYRLQAPSLAPPPPLRHRLSRYD